MSLIKCSECGKEISDQAPACVHCGCPVSKSNVEQKPIDLNEAFGDLFGGKFSGFEGDKTRTVKTSNEQKSANGVNATAKTSGPDSLVGTMDSKKKIMGFIKPNSTLAIVMMIPPLTLFGIIILLTTTLPAKMRAKKSIEKLENSGKLDKAAAELSSQNTKRLINGRIVLTDNFVFCKFIGCVFEYSEILWAYKGSKRGSDMLFVATKDMTPMQVASIDFDRMNEVKNSLIEIYNHNNHCMIGYTKENEAKYRKITVQ